nr:hypothetical protein [Tanacetum cinerariifolium]
MTTNESSTISYRKENALDWRDMMTYSSHPDLLITPRQKDTHDSAKQSKEYCIGDQRENVNVPNRNKRQSGLAQMATKGNLGRLLPHARGLGFKPRRGGFPSGAKMSGVYLLR